MVRPLDADFEDAWRRAVIFLGSSTNEELLDVSLHPHDLLFRLFSEDGVRAFDPSPFCHEMPLFG